MIFYDMDKVAQNAGVQNKYVLTSVVAQRARQLSEIRGREVLDEGSGEKYISTAMAEMEQGELSVTFTSIGLQPSSIDTHEPISVAE